DPARATRTSSLAVRISTPVSSRAITRPRMDMALAIDSAAGLFGPGAERGRNESPQGSSLDAFDVLLGAGVHLDELALVDEQRHLDLGPGRYPRRLGHVAGRIPARAGLCLGNLDLDEVGQAHPHGAVVEEQDRALEVVHHQIVIVTQD